MRADLVGVDGGGRITIVECKLRANPQIRREIVGQVPAYAGAIWQMGTDDFCSAGRRSQKPRPGHRAGGPGRAGGAASIILQPTPARSLVVEVMEELGAPANRAAVNRVLYDLRRFSGKTVTETRTTLPAGSSARRWSERELAAVADPSATIPQGNGRFALRMLFVRGQNVRSPNILAVSFRGDTFAAFPDQYASSGQNVITTVTVHEVGHLLGLDDLYLNRRRSDRTNDPAVGGHSATGPASWTSPSTPPCWAPSSAPPATATTPRTSAAWPPSAAEQLAASNPP